MESPWILVICHEFPPIGGGAAKNLFLLCRELTHRGVKVRVWTGSPGTGNPLHPAGFEVDYIHTGRRYRFETTLKGMLAFAIRTVFKAWREGIPDASPPPALVLSCLGIPAGLAGDLVSRSFGAPHAVWYHGSDIHGGNPRGPGRLQRMLIRRIAGRAALNLFISPGLRDMALALAGNSGGGIPGAGILPSCPSQEILAADTMAGDATLAEGRYLLFLGRMESVKNPLLAVEAMALLKAGNRPLPRLRMVGAGRAAEVVRALIRKHALAGNISVEPAASFDQVPRILRGAYALLVPSRIEGFNTTILEAAHFGVPTVGSDTVGIRDFVRHGDTGLLHAENDAVALAEAIGTLAADRPLRDAMGERARLAALPYRAERVADLFLAAVTAAFPIFSAAPPAAAPEEAAACP